MPELPEVEVLRRSLEPHLLSSRLLRVEVRDRRLREPVPVTRLARTVRERRVVELGRRSKYLLLHLDDGAALLVHLGMSGSLSIARPRDPFDRHDHVVFTLDRRRQLRFRDPRRFGLVLPVAAGALDRHPRLAGLGIEPLAGQFDGRWLYTASRGVRAPIKSFLMDARRIAGVGNIYANEALFLAGVHPRRAAGRISAPRCAGIADGVRRVLQAAIREGGTTLSDFRDGEGNSGYFEVRLRVYGRDGEPCERCARPLRRLQIAGRSTFYCAGCQR